MEAAVRGLAVELELTPGRYRKFLEEHFQQVYTGPGDWAELYAEAAAVSAEVESRSVYNAGSQEQSWWPMYSCSRSCSPSLCQGRLHSGRLWG